MLGGFSEKIGGVQEGKCQIPTNGGPCPPTKNPRKCLSCRGFCLSYPAWIRTRTKRTKISCATVTLPGKKSCRFVAPAASCSPVCVGHSPATSASPPRDARPSHIYTCFPGQGEGPLPKQMTSPMPTRVRASVVGEGRLVPVAAPAGRIRLWPWSGPAS